MKDLNYVTAKNYVDGIEANAKRSYTSHKALATTLKAGTTYSFRVGTEQAGAKSAILPLLPIRTALKRGIPLSI